MKRNILCLLCLVVLLVSCRDSTEDKISQLLHEWIGKEVCFPQNMDLTSYVDTNATVNFEDWKASYTILHYVDTAGCVSCKLQLSRWRAFVAELDSVSHYSAKCLLSFSPMNKAILLKSLRINKFNHYVFIDEKDSLNQLNAFPANEAFHTLLLDKNNKVLAMGNPIHNPNIKDLYLRIIRGESPQAPSDAGTPVTTVSVSSAEADLGTFPWQEPRTCTFTLRNTGDRPLVIHDVSTSCGCLTVDYPEEPARPGEELTLRAHYRADSRGTVLKSMQVYCNAQGSPLRLRVTGTAE